MPEVIGGNGAGIVCDRSSPKDFADACIRILENDDLKSIGEKGESIMKTILRLSVWSSNIEL